MMLQHFKVNVLGAKRYFAHSAAVCMVQQLRLCRRACCIQVTLNKQLSYCRKLEPNVECGHHFERLVVFYV